MLIAGVINGFTFILIVFEVSVRPLEQLASLITIQVILSPSTSVEEVYELLLATTLLFNFHIYTGDEPAFNVFVWKVTGELLQILFADAVIDTDGGVVVTFTTILLHKTPVADARLVF